MATQLINNDVPAKLLAIALKIDVEAYSAAERSEKLQQLEKLAAKHIPLRRPGTVAQTPRADIHPELAVVLNKYDYSKVGKLKMFAAEKVIVPWVRANLKLKR